MIELLESHVVHHRRRANQVLEVQTYANCHEDFAYFLRRGDARQPALLTYVNTASMAVGAAG